MASENEPKKITILVYDSIHSGPPGKILCDLTGSDLVENLREKIANSKEYKKDAFNILSGVKLLDDFVPIDQIAKGASKIACTIKRKEGSKEDDFGTPSPNKDRLIPEIARNMGSGAIVPSSSAIGSSTMGPHLATSWYARDYNKKSDTGFVGLSNQAATCYLNSLIQSLFMTPEFRNAIFKWDFEGWYSKWRTNHPEATLESIGNQTQKNNNNNANSNNNSSKSATSNENSKAEDKPPTPEEMEAMILNKKASYSIPRQLQLLFARLMLSKQRAVKTKALTHSFGWTDRDAFTQHDVQEMCRQLFDALEQVLQGTDQANLIKDLYQGQMKDYLKCKECNYESNRLQSYLDIQLVLKGFGETKSVSSIEEAMAKWIQVETLEGANQYFCERCNKKVDAEKGLSLVSLPYFLTLQLERFTYDWEKETRVKINDHVTFPLLLDMNQFLGATALRTSQVRPTVDLEDYAKSIKLRKIDTDNAPAHNPTSNKEETTPQDEEEARKKRNDQEQEEINHYWNNQVQQLLKNGKYIYELFAILIHKGSAMSGHYYAYIKNLETKRSGTWYEFDDRNVSELKVSDIKDAFGEEAPRLHQGRFSGMMSSSATAYMLVYRQISDNNQNFVAPDKIPEPLRKLMEQENERYTKKEEEKKRKRESLDIRAFFRGAEKTLSFHNSTKLRDILTEIAKTFGVLERYPADCMRLRNYQPYNELPVEPVEEEMLDKTLEELNVYSSKSVLLEVKEKDEQFPIYNPQEMMLRVIKCNPNTNKFEPAVNVFIDRNCTLQEFKQMCQSKFSIPAAHCRVVIENLNIFGPIAKVLEGDSASLRRDHFIIEAQKVFIELCTDPTSQSQIFEEIERTRNLIEIKYNKIGEEDFKNSLEVSKKMGFDEFKKTVLGPIAQLPPDEFKVSRVNYYSYRYELRAGSTLTLDDLHISDGTRLYLEKGSPLRDGEIKIDFWVFQPLKTTRDEQFQMVFSLPVQEDMLVSEIKELAVARLNEKLKSDNKEPLTTPAKHFRLREQFARSPARIYPDNKKLKDAAHSLYNGKDLALQEMDAPEIVQGEQHFSLFVMQFLPDSYGLGPLKELIIDDKMRVTDFVDELAKAHNIEKLGIAKCPSGWPRPNVLEVPELDWNREIPDNTEFPSRGTMGNAPYYFRDGDLLLFRDENVPLRKLTEDEKKKVKVESHTTSYRKEESIHIQIDKD